jgi:glucose/mannose-6-phosphate isomerase
MEYDSLVKEFDKQGMINYLQAFPSQLKEAIAMAKKIKQKKKKISNIVLCGMGGSGIGGAVTKSLLKREIKVPIDTVNDYQLPEFVGKNSLVFTVSYSGNTEETVSCFDEAKKRKATAIAITAGGLLAQKDKNAIIVPKAVPQPRLAFAYLFTPIIFTIAKLGLIKDKEKEFLQAIKELEQNREAVKLEAQRLALEMQDKIPIIYAESELAPLTYRFCTEINENSKQFAHNQFVPEMNHNEINATHGTEKLVLLLLRDKKEREKISQRFEISKQIWGNNFKIVETWIDGSSLLSRILQTVWLETMTAFYLSMLNKEDPIEIPSIKFLKTAIKEKKG